MEAIKPILYSQVENGRRRPIHWQTEGKQVLLSGIRTFSRLGITEGDTTVSAIEKLAMGVESSEGNIGVPIIGRSLVSGEVAIPVDGWIQDGGWYYLDIVDESISEDSIPALTVYPDSLDTARSCGFRSVCETRDGALRVFAKSVPGAVIVASLAALSSTVGGGDGGALPVATTSSLGAVKVGSGLDIQRDGTLSVNLPDEDGNGIPDVIEKTRATDAEVTEMLNEVFGTSSPSSETSAVAYGDDEF